MPAAPKPFDEEQRLTALLRLGLLDSEFEECFDRITRLAQRLLGVSTAVISLVDADRQWFKSRQGTELAQTPREHAFCAHAILEAEPLIVSDASTDARFSDSPLVTKDPNIRFYIGVPISSSDGHRIGTLCVMDETVRDPTADELATMCDLAKIVEQEIATSDLAMTDDLTGLANRRGFFAIANQLHRIADRLEKPMVIFMVDIDNMKEINDTHGHQEGDEVLREVAQAIKHTFRDTDVVARLGGDEFCVAMLGTNESDGLRATQRLERALESQCRQRPHDYTIALSYGVARHTTDRIALIEKMLDQADQAMYEHKSAKSSQ